MLIKRFLPILIMLFLVMPVTAQTGGFTPFAWEEANLALLIPSEWTASAVVQEEQPALEVRGSDGLINLWVLPATTTDETLRPTLEILLSQLGITRYTFNAALWFGRTGWEVTGGSQAAGFGRIGRLPDRRVLVMAGTNVPLATWNAVANSIVFSADSVPTAPSYALEWSISLPDDGLEDTPPLQIIALAYSPLGQLYALDATQGVLVFDPITGAYITTYAFPNPSQPSSITVDATGTVYIADVTCRCLQVLANGGWGTPLGSFGGSAPVDVDTAPNSTLYALDRAEEGYAISQLRGGTSQTIPLSFNGAAAPLVAVDSDGQVMVIEWLSSLIDGNINGALSTVESTTVTLQNWLDVTPEMVNDLAINSDNQLVLALSDGRIALVNADGSLAELARETVALNALTFALDGTMFVARADGTLVARSAAAPPDRTGDGTIRADVPVQGTLSETLARQEWRYEGTAGDQITISAVDMMQNDGLDMAVRLIGPDGGEQAFNDDQRGADLYGRFDAQIADQVLRDTGTYTIVAEWVQGAGTYTLGVSANRSFSLTADAAVRLEGSLQEVFPVQRWVFEGQTGQVVTFTMFGESGDLDPILQILQPGGSRLAYNDDAYDPELGVNAQLFRITLPDTGVYVLEASRFEGSGDYSVVGLINSSTP